VWGTEGKATQCALRRSSEPIARFVGRSGGEGDRDLVEGPVFSIRPDAALAHARSLRERAFRPADKEGG